MKEFKDLWNHILILILACTILVYLSYYMHTLGTWWGDATVLISIILIVYGIVVIVVTTYAYYETVESNSKSFAVSDRDKKIYELQEEIRKYKLMLTDGKNNVVSKAILEEILDSSQYDFEIRKKLNKEIRYKY